MDVFYSYTHCTAAWLGIQSLSLITIPRLIIGLLAQEAHYASDLEIYFSRSLGFALAILALIVLFFTGTVPLSSSIREPVSLDENDPKSPYAVPILRITTLFHFLMTSYCYVRWTSFNLTGYILGAFGYGILACVGSWCIMFGTTGGRLSKRTGADKRTTGFPFKNVSAYDKKIDRKMG